MVMPMTTQERKEELRHLVGEILEVDPGELTDDSLFNEDLGADSMRVIEILAAMEKTYGVTIDQSELSRMVNLAGVYAVVSKAAGWQ